MSNSYTLELEAQERISVEELASLILKILKRNLSTKKRIVSYYPGSLSSIKSFEFLRGPGDRHVKIHPDFEKKFAQAVQMLRNKELIMQDHEQTQSSELVELTPKGEEMEPEQFLPTVESSEKMIETIERSAGYLDEVAKVYLSEAHETFKSDFKISSAFCLGAMSERYVLLLAEAAEKNLNEPAVTRAYSQCKTVKHYANFISDNISRLQKKYPGNDKLFRDLDTKINTLAAYYRLTRNEAGHPDFVPKIERPELELALKTIPKYLETIIKVIKLI